MSLQERTLVVRNFDPDRTTPKLLKELCLQGGPVRKVVMRLDHAFVEYEDIESVGYSKALLDGIKMFDHSLSFEPKLRLNMYAKYTRALHDYIRFDREQEQRADQQRQQLIYQQQQQQQLLLQQQQQQMQYHPQYMPQMQMLPSQMQQQQQHQPILPQRYPHPYQLVIQNQLGYQHLPSERAQYLAPQMPPLPAPQPPARQQFYQRRR